MLFVHRWVIQYALCDVAISCGSRVLMWLHIQSLVAVACELVWRVLLRKYNGTCIKTLKYDMYCIKVTLSRNFPWRHRDEWCSPTIIYLNVRWEWVVSATSRPLYPRPTHIIKEDRWDSGPFAFVRIISPLPWFDPPTFQLLDDRYTVELHHPPYTQCIE